MNEDKIKVLEFAIDWLKHQDNYTGICDAINHVGYMLSYPSRLRLPSNFKIRLPKKVYKGRCTNELLFSFPTTKKGKQQRIKVLQEAIKKLQS